MQIFVKSTVVKFIFGVVTEKLDKTSSCWQKNWQSMTITGNYAILVCIYIQFLCDNKFTFDVMKRFALKEAPDSKRMRCFSGFYNKISETV